MVIYWAIYFVWKQIERKWMFTQFSVHFIENN